MKKVFAVIWTTIKIIFAIPIGIFIGLLILPFSLGKIYKSFLMPIQWLSYFMAFLISALFLIAYLATFATVSWFITMASSTDQVGNTAINGNQDNTVSGRLGAKIKAGKANCCEKLFCRILSLIDPTSKTHCTDAVEHDERNVI